MNETKRMECLIVAEMAYASALSARRAAAQVDRDYYSRDAQRLGGLLLRLCGAQ